MQAVRAAYDWSRFGRRASGNLPPVDETQKNIRPGWICVGVGDFQGCQSLNGCRVQQVAYSESRVCVEAQHSLRSNK